MFQIYIILSQYYIDESSYRYRKYGDWNVSRASNKMGTNSTSVYEFTTQSPTWITKLKADAPNEIARHTDHRYVKPKVNFPVFVSMVCVAIGMNHFLPSEIKNLWVKWRFLYSIVIPCISSRVYVSPHFSVVPTLSKRRTSVPPCQRVPGPNSLLCTCTGNLPTPLIPGISIKWVMHNYQAGDQVSAGDLARRRLTLMYVTHMYTCRKQFLLWGRCVKASCAEWNSFFTSGWLVVGRGA